MSPLDSESREEPAWRRRITQSGSEAETNSSAPPGEMVTINVNGREVGDLDSLPPAVREQVERDIERVLGEITGGGPLTVGRSVVSESRSCLIETDPSSSDPLADLPEALQLALADTDHDGQISEEERREFNLKWSAGDIASLARAMGYQETAPGQFERTQSHRVTRSIGLGFGEALSAHLLTQGERRGHGRGQHVIIALLILTILALVAVLLWTSGGPTR
ncbi:hypothetical protein JXA47_16820 [Candidatus Sumerlaeota bacterium]|nr:hypothetical protein [Candidatus Sumerlaeota bacterium]